MSNNNKTRKLTLLANFLAIAIVLSLIESAINVIPVPGAKLGLANVVTLIVIYKYSFKEGLILTIARVLLVSILSGRLLSPTFYMSFSGALLSVMIIGALRKVDYFGILGVSVLGSISHVIGQIFAGIFVIGSAVVIFYLPIMLFLSIPAGVAIGAISKRFLQIFEKLEPEKSKIV